MQKKNNDIEVIYSAKSLAKIINLSATRVSFYIHNKRIIPDFISYSVDKNIVNHFFKLSTVNKIKKWHDNYIFNRKHASSKMKVCN